MSNSQQELAIISCWQSHAKAWQNLLTTNGLESRRLVTNQAIVQQLKLLSFESVIDIGCGEGWLTRELLNLGKKVTAIDAIPYLIEQARKNSQADYFLCDYQSFAQRRLKLTSLDLAVANFSLLGEQSTVDVFKGLSYYLKTQGYFVIQTIHPVTVADNDYRSGWRDDAFKGLNNFSQQAPWYFRNFANWFQLFKDHNFTVIDFLEPLHPKTHLPCSAIFVLQKQTD